MNYLNGMSRNTKSIKYINKKIHFRNIEHWIKNADKILKEDIEERQNNIKSKNIKILEMDENECIRDISLLNITDTEVCQRNYIHTLKKTQK